MIPKHKLRMPLDIAMTLLSIVLMGGTVLFASDLTHQILGLCLLALWAAHFSLNYRYYTTLFRGKYAPYRILQTVINSCILLCAILLGVSGIMMGSFLSSSVPVPLGFARSAHLISSHWYYFFMCAHIGLHLNMIFSKIAQRRAKPLSSRASLALKALAAAVCVYGAFAFYARGLWRYMFGVQQFFFFDFDKGYLLFFVDYIAILVLFAFLTHIIARRLL